MRNKLYSQYVAKCLTPGFMMHEYNLTLQPYWIHKLHTKKQMRFFLFVGLLLIFSPHLKSQVFEADVVTLYDERKAPFYFGVASGDPQPESIILWTKIVSDSSKIKVSWTIAEDTVMSKIVAEGVASTNDSSAYTVKIRVDKLQPGKYYYYRFQHNGQYSVIGRTKTAPTQAEQLRFAVVSCNNYTSGYFNAFRAISQRNDIDAVVHLGDYIYEYANKLGGKFKAIRNHIPMREIVSLKDYRSRYAQYRLDEDLQEMHRLFPFISIWDDHEVANNSYKDGAQNHQPEEGNWEERKAIAKQVYFEWLPLEDNTNLSIIRKISYGNLADLFMLDERLEARSKQLKHYNDSSYLSSNRFMIGDAQADWLMNSMLQSTAKWKVMANQVIFSELDVNHISKKIGRIMDAWDGYPVERKKLMDFFYANNIKNIIILTGDIHSSWAFDLVANPSNKMFYKRKTGQGVIGAEFVVTSVTSSNADERVPRGLAKMVGALAKNKKHNPHLLYNNVVDHGYMTLLLTSNEARADWYYVQTVKKPTDKQRKSVSWSTYAENNRLTENKD